VIIVIGYKNYGEPLEHIDRIVNNTRELLNNPKKVSLVMFTGGEDVHPSLYGGVDSHVLCSTNIRRDEFERRVFGFCRQHNIKMTGICRGIQFLNVMAGGEMYQHVTNHAGLLHDAYFPYDSSIRVVTSTHHQLVSLPSSSIPIAYIGAYGDEEEPPEREIEAAIFPKINAMGVQYHPEMMKKDDPCKIHYGEMIANFIKMEMKEFINKYGRRTAHVGN
jgi:gamma-glutamyl-gamma-aminobutyrate hydrolase PuuD